LDTGGSLSLLYHPGNPYILITIELANLLDCSFVLTLNSEGYAEEDKHYHRWPVKN